MRHFYQWIGNPCDDTALGLWGCPDKRERGRMGVTVRERKGREVIGVDVRLRGILWEGAARVEGSGIESMNSI